MKDYQRKNLEKGMWKKGQSGNPKGRPRGALGVKTIIRRFFETADTYRHPVTGEEVKASVLEVLILKQIAKARDGDLKALQELLDRCEGKAVQSIYHNHEPEESVVENMEQLDERIRELEGDLKGMSKKESAIKRRRARRGKDGGGEEE